MSPERAAKVVDVMFLGARCPVLLGSTIAHTLFQSFVSASKCVPILVLNRVSGLVSREGDGCQEVSSMGNWVHWSYC